MMDITIDEAIKAMSLFRDTAPENGYVASCYNMAISALKTIQDGNYKLSTTNVSRETLEEMANFKCHILPCSQCKYSTIKDKHYVCMSIKAKQILNNEQNIKELIQWITTHYQN